MDVLSWTLETHDSIPSTQDIIKDHAHAGAPEGTAVQALEQLCGHGRHGRTWDSPKGNLYLSFLLRPECGASMVGQVSLLVALALAQVIERYTDQVRLKWPNDVMLDGRKCAGILLETELGTDDSVQWVAIGTGVNIAGAPQGVRLCDYIRDDIDVNTFRDAFLAAFGDLYVRWQEDGFEALRAAWLSRAHPLGSAVSVKVGEQLEKGFFHDIDAQGNLRLQSENGAIKTITAGDVYLYDDVSNVISN